MITIKEEEDYEFSFWPQNNTGADASIMVIHKPSGVAVIEGSGRSYMQNQAKGVARLTDILIRAGILGCSHEA
jgi:hypothetical protein